MSYGQSGGGQVDDVWLLPTEDIGWRLKGEYRPGEWWAEPLLVVAQWQTVDADELSRSQLIERNGKTINSVEDLSNGN